MFACNRAARFNAKFENFRGERLGRFFLPRDAAIVPFGKFPLLDFSTGLGDTILPIDSQPLMYIVETNTRN